MVFTGHSFLCASLLCAVGALSDEACCSAQDGPARTTAVQQEPDRLKAPVVTACCADCALDGPADTNSPRCHHCCALDSRVRQHSWVVVPPVPLQIQVGVNLPERKRNQVNCVELYSEKGLLDCRYFERKDKDKDKDKEELSANFRVSLSPGRHKLYARYRKGVRWSLPSKPLLIEVRFPQPPKIISVSAANVEASEPLPATGAVNVSCRNLRVRLSNVKPGDKALLYLNGRLLECRTNLCQRHCTVSASIKEPSGIYTLTARVVPTGCDRQLASRPSKPVLIRYQPDRYCAKWEERPFRFPSAAHFPIRQFGPGGRLLDREGAVIYEGMEFSWDEKGWYGVRFRVSTPAVPTTLHLRFLVLKDDGHWGTATLPPIYIDPAEDSPDQFSPSVRTIKRSGYSRAIHEVNGDFKAIRREGTARFGFGTSLDRRS